MLYIVSTPIGNIEDITFRAVRVLSEADLILAEDTRKTGLLLNRLNIKGKKFLSFYEHNEYSRINQVISLLKQGKKICLVSSAGTPLISDPGFKLVRKCIEENLDFTAVPGPSAAINALVLSGLGTDKFLFLGFLPRKKTQRQILLKKALDFPATIVIFLPLRKLPEVLEEIVFCGGAQKNCAIIKEMTKIHERMVTGKIEGLMQKTKSLLNKGEAVLIIGR